MRIVSLLASATEAVYALGLGDHLVGISHECDYPPEALHKPRVSRPRFDPTGLSSGEIDAALRETMRRHGSVYMLDEDLLRSLDPDLLLTQAVCDVCAVPTSLARQAAAVLDDPTVLSLDSHTIDEILDGFRSIARAAGAPARGERLVAASRARMADVARRVAGAPRPNVLALEWLEPVFVPGHWAPEMIARAGGTCLAGEVARPSRQVSWDHVAALDPDVLLVMPCGYKLDAATADADRHADRLLSLAGRAVDNGRAFVLNGSDYFNRSGPRTIDGVEILGTLLHPERFPEYDTTGKAAVWQGAEVRSKELRST